jgi:hypothetical protein
MEYVNPSNVQNMMLKVLARNRTGQGSGESKRQASIYRKLLESIPPMREMAKRKELENLTLQKRLEEEGNTGSSMVVIKERITSRATVSVDGIEAEVPRVDGPTEIRSDGHENLVVNRGNQTRAEENKGKS